MEQVTAGDGVSLEVRGLAKRFPNGTQLLTVLSDVSLSVAAGERVAITGESGSGKSTLLSLIAGLDTPDSGEILVGNEAVHQLDEAALTVYRSRRVGLVFQFHYLLQDFTALENVMMPALMAAESATRTGGRRGRAGRARGEIRDRAASLLETVGLADRREHLPAQLSGGERQRVALARALVNDPPVLLADEPTGNLDDRNSGMVEDLLLSLVDTFGRTLVLVTHNRDLAARSGRILELEAGCLVSA